MTNLDSILKSRYITLPTKVCPVKAMVFPVLVYGCESWTIKKAECWRIDAFALWCWRRLLRVLWTVRRFNQSILKEISPGCLLEGLMLKLKLQYFGHLMGRSDSLKKTLMLGKTEAGGEGDDRGRDGWMASPTGGTWVWAGPGRWWRTGKPSVLQSLKSQRVGHYWATEQQEWWGKVSGAPCHPGLQQDILFQRVPTPHSPISHKVPHFYPTPTYPASNPVPGSQPARGE